MYDHTLLYTCKSPDETSHKVKWAVSLVIADGLINLPRQYVWVYTHFMKPKSIGGNRSLTGIHEITLKISVSLTASLKSHQQAAGHVTKLVHVNHLTTEIGAISSSGFFPHSFSPFHAM